MHIGGRGNQPKYVLGVQDKKNGKGSPPLTLRTIS